jgi:hypothetical protein
MRDIAPDHVRSSQAAAAKCLSAFLARVTYSSGTSPGPQLARALMMSVTASTTRSPRLERDPVAGQDFEGGLGPVRRFQLADMAPGRRIGR